MRIFARVSSLWRNLFQRPRVDAAVDDELQSFLQMLIDRNVRSGMSPEEARRAATLDVGGTTQVKEQVREIRAGFLVETFLQDVRIGARSLWNSRPMTVAAVLSLGVGIGLNSVIFSAIDAVLLRPLPYRDPDRLVSVAQTLKRYKNGLEPAGIAAANFLDWQSQSRSFEGMAVYDRVNTRRVLTVREGATAVRGYNVSAKFFSVLGVQAAMGRTFLSDEDKPDPSVVVLSDRLWRQHFAAEPQVLGRSLTVDGKSRVIVGVMPRQFHYYQPSEMSTDQPEIDLFVPYAFENSDPTNRQYYGNSAIARLKPGVSVEQARTELNVIAQQLAKSYPTENKDSGAWVSPLQFESPATRSALWFAWGAASLLLLIACANVTGLVLVKTEARRQEMAVRAALGAGRARLIRQLLTESLLLALAGGFTGVLIAASGSRVLEWIVPNAEQVRRLQMAGADLRVVAFTLLVSVIVGLLCGVGSALRGSRLELLPTIKDGGRTASSGRGGARVRSALVMVQVAIAMVLLTGAALMVSSLRKLYELRLGFQTEQLLTLQTQLPVRAPYADPSGSGEDARGTSNRVKQWKITPASLQFPERVIERLLQTPGVRSAAVASGAPMIRTISTRFQIEGRGVPPPEEEQRMDGPLWYVTPGYFRTLKIDLRQGRDFDQRDKPGSIRVAVVNEFIARTWWPDRESTLGERIQIGSPLQSYEIVGVAADVRAWPRQQTGPQLYVPMSQNMQPLYADRAMLMRLQFSMLVRTSADPASVAGAIRSTLREVAEDAPLERVRPMTEVIGQAFRPWRSTMLLFVFTGGLSLLLAAVGIYGVISYATSRRINEIAIRIAMGANPASVRWLVMKSGLVLIGVGTLLGVSAAYGLTRFIASQLFGVRPADPTAIAGAALMLVIAGLAACYLPARRACSMDPMVALRNE